MPKPSSPGYVRVHYPIAANDATVFNAAGAANVAVGVLPGFRCYLERLSLVASIAGAGAGATQTFRLRKGGATGTIIGTLTVTLAGADTVGEYATALVPSASDAAAYLGDTDTFSITRDAGGTVFTTAPVGQWVVTLAQQPQARR